MQEKPQTEQISSENVEKSSRNSSGVLFLATIALIIAMVSLIFQFFFWELHKKAKEKMVDGNQQIHQMIEKNLANIKEEQNNQQQLLNDLLNKNQTEERKKALMLANEAEHLLTYAQYNIEYVNNLDLAANQIVEADQKLQLMNDPSINPVRQSLMNDLTSINNTPKVDVTALISRLSAISEQVTNLRNMPKMPPTERPVKALPKTQLTWKERLMETLNNLKGILTIRRMSEEVKPLDSPEQQIFTTERIRLKLTEAEWAVLHQSPSLYQASLSQARMQLEKYYPRNQSATNLIKMIADLEQINIKPSLPSLAKTINLLRSYVNTSAQPAAQDSLPPSNSQQPQASQDASLNQSRLDSGSKMPPETPSQIRETPQPTSPTSGAANTQPSENSQPTNSSPSSTLPPHNVAPQAKTGTTPRALPS